MLTIFGFQDVIEVVTVGFVESGRNATEEQKLIFKQQQKLDSKARLLIYQCVKSKIFNKIFNVSTSNEAWEILMKTYGDGEKNKKTLRTQYELLEMEGNESIANYFDRIQELVNAMRACKEKISDQQVIDKILRTLPQPFNHVAVAIEESKNLDIMETEELQHSFEAHEMRARNNYKGKDKGPWKGNKYNTNQKHQDQEIAKTNESSKERRTDQAHKQDYNSKNSKEWKFGKGKMRCHNCQKLGHYARECWVGEGANARELWTGKGAKNKPNNRAHLTQDEGTNSDSEVVVLMPITSNKAQPRIPIEEEEKELRVTPVFNKAYIKLVDPPSNKKLIALKWVYKVKVNPRGEVVKNKVRFVAKGFLQKARIDYGEVYAPIAKIETIRLVVAIAINTGWSMHQLDVKSTFLNGPLEEEVYVDQLLSFVVKGKENKLMNEFEMSDLGLLSYFLGIEFEMTRYEMVMHHSKYAKDLLKRLNMQQSNPTRTPTEYGDKQDRKNITGYIFFYVRAPVSRSSTKEPIVTLSSYKAEYIAASETTCQAVWLDALLGELKEKNSKKVKLLVDNKSAIDLVRHPMGGANI
ncbi:Copia protein, partial [Mucuna pruriens]